MISLKPFFKGTKVKYFKFSTFDIESRGWIDYMCSAAAWRDSKTGKLVNKEFKDIYEYLEFVFSDDHPCDVVYMHAGGIFDFDFILGPVFELYKKYRIIENIQRSNGFLLFKIAKLEKIKEGERVSAKRKILIDGVEMKKTRVVEFRDSMGLLPFGLDNLSKDFDVEHKKLDTVDRSNLTELTDEIIKYNIYDCYALLEILEKFQEWPLIREVGMSATMAGQSMKVFRKYIKTEINSLLQNTDEFIRKGYFGGRTEIFKCLYDSDEKDDLLHYYDYNSLYPYCMLEEMPTIETKDKITDIHSEMGFVECDVEVPKMYAPPLPVVAEVNNTSKLIFPTGTFRGVFSTIELSYAVKCGVKILKIHKSIKFQSGGKIFKKYILDMYKMRKEAPKNTPTNVICKLLMNSLYGRWGLNIHREEIVFNPPSILGLKYHSHVDTIHGRVEFFVSPKKLDKSFTNVAVAAWVTSLARIHLHKTLKKFPNDIYYCDTDSVMITRDLKVNSDLLGELKKEFSIKKAAFLLPKTYILDETSGKHKKVVAMKGFDRKIVQKFNLSDFRRQLEGEMRLKVGPSHKKAKFRSALKLGSFLALKHESGRSIQSVYDKRAFILGSKNYDTEPLNVKNGEVTNLDLERQSRKMYEVRRERELLEKNLD